MTTSASPIGITGSTGQLGGRVASRLATLGHHQRLLVRNPARAPQLPGAEIVQASRARFNPSDWELEAWVSTYLAIATGEMSVVSHTVQALTGHTPQTLADYLRRHPESYRHVTATRS